MKENIKSSDTEIGWRNMNSVHVVQDSDKWWTVVNTVMNIQVSQNARNVWTN